MHKKIIIQGRTIPYTLRKSKRACRIKISVRPDRTVMVTVPYVSGANMAEKFLREKAGWVIAKINYFEKWGQSPLARYGKADYAKYKNAALVLVKRRIAELNLPYGHKYKTIRIKNQKTCWGSCSREGNLNFNFRILFLPEYMQNYIIIHELCHLNELSHSSRFWELVGETVPNYREIKRELRQNTIGFI